MQYVHFEHKPLVQVKVGGISVSLYPVLDAVMTPAERAHGYHVIKNNLLAANLPPLQLLNALGHQTGQSAVVEGSVAGFIRYFHDHWRDFRNLTILSWHDSTGTIINNTTTPGDSAILLPVQNGALASCRQQDVMFVRVQVSVDYTYAIRNGVSPIRVDFYIELPQSSTAMVNGGGGAYTLVTYAGPADIRTLNTAQSATSILNPTFQANPGQIVAATFGATSATLNQSAMTEIESKILRVVYPSIFADVFMGVAPNYTDQPEAALEHVKQIVPDSNGSPQCRTVQQYYTQFMAACQAFIKNRSFPVNAAEKFKSNMDPDLFTFFKQVYPNHTDIVGLDALLQLQALRDMLSSAQRAEDNRKMISTAALSAVNAQSFMITGTPPTQALPSQAETTLTQYKKREVTCFGCGGPHPWSNRKEDGTYIIVCPNKDKAGIRATADAKIADIRKKRKARKDKYDEKDKDKRKDYKKAKTSSNAAFDADSTTSNSNRKVFIIQSHVPVLAAGEHRPAMPVATTNALPHILLGLGPDMDTANCPDIRCAVDTCAGLNTGSYAYLMALAKKYPHCLHKLYTSREYAPITLSGIVQNGDIAVTASLDCTFQFHLPYKLQGSGEDTIIAIAAGRDVAVNVILGLPFITAMQMIIDMREFVATCYAIDHHPFPIELRQTSNAVPAIDVAANVGTFVNETVIQLEAYESWRLAQSAPPRQAAAAVSSAETVPPILRNVRFGGDPSSSLSVRPTDTHADLNTIVLDALSESQNLTHGNVQRLEGFIPPTLSVMKRLSSVLSAEHVSEPIRVAHKPKRQKQIHNAFIDDRGFPDQSDEYDHLLHNVDGRPIIRKLLHPTPDLDGPVDPLFQSIFDPTEHESIMREQLDLSHLSLEVQDQVYALIREFWSVFDGKGYIVPVKNYECIIDTGTARPIAIKKILYGEHESGVMRKCIAKLNEVGHIRQIHDGAWLFKALLAPKPHQEHIHNIEDFIWRFCVNYIPLNMITRVIAYPIPRCDTAVHSEFGGGPDGFMWLYDAPQGYHQLKVSPESQLKLAFQGPDAIKWTYNVMPFGPTNGPATFINFAHDICSVWQEEAKRCGVPVGDMYNTRIIVDDFINWGATLALSLLYIRCQLKVCQAYNLSLSLKKMRIFPPRFEFVGIDVTPGGNLPAQSKHVLLQTWPTPTDVRDVAKFIGFGQFYARFIPNYELRIPTLRSLTSNDYSTVLGNLWTPAAQSEFDDIRKAILDDPCIKRFDSTKMTVIRTDFSALGFGYCLLQPGDDEASKSAAQDYRDGKGFTFMTKSSRGVLHPVCFGARKTKGNETRLHSHLGEGFSGDYGINKCRQYIFAQRFVWVTDCYAVKFILSYEGSNPAILRLQMRLMCWDVDIVHRPDTELVDADYWSRLGIDVDYDPLYDQYLRQTRQFRVLHPAVVELPMLPENMPYYRGPRFRPPADAAVQPDATVALDTANSVAAELGHVQSLMTATSFNTHDSPGPLCNMPVTFGTVTARPVSSEVSSRVMYNSEFAAYALQTSTFSWAVYNFSNGHFTSTIESLHLSFTIRVGCDTTQRGRALFGEFAPEAHLCSTGNEFLNHIRSSGDRSVLHGYLINTFRFRTSEITNAFWSLQLQIVAQLRLIRSTSVIVAIVIPDLDGAATAKFIKGLESAHWIVSRQKVHYVDIGDSVDDSSIIITAVHSSCASTVVPLQLILPPKCDPKPLGAYVHAPFNLPQHSVCYGRDDELFNTDESVKVTCADPQVCETLIPPSVKQAYSLHREGDQMTVMAGAMVLSTNGLCPPFDWGSTNNVFQHLFGIEFHHDGHTYVRPFSAFEFTRCFNLIENIQYRLSHSDFKFALDAAMPSFTSAWLFSQVNSTLELLRALNTEVFSPNQITAPAATVQTLLNGSTCTKMPSHSRWQQAYDNDKEMCALKHLVLNPSLISNATLAEVNYNYRMPLRKSQLCIENDILIFQEPILGTSSFTRLQVVPKELYNIIFIAFHANPIGGHLNAYRTLHRIRLRFYFPNMYKYITRMCNACPGCALSNPTKRISSELIYNFPIQAPFKLMHFDAYQAGKHQSFEGNDCHLIGCCGMTGFACSEPISQPSAKTFASGIMKILLRFGFCDTAVLDKDSKFFGVCREALDLLQINRHVLSGNNHNAMMVERVNRYLNKGLRIICNDSDSIRVSQEAILLLLYAWNSCPMPGTDISRSFCAVGREFAFPIDYSSNKHFELTATPPEIRSYSKTLATQLDAMKEVAQLLIGEMRAYHREYINSQRPDPKVYSIGDTVFARRAVKSVASRGQVGKLQLAYTGPWKITQILDGASYEIQHVRNSDKRDKKHASDLSPYPIELIAFEPLDGADTRYGQLYKPMSAKRFDDAGLTGFLPSNPYQQFDMSVPSNYLMTKQKFQWPTLSDLNDALDKNMWDSDKDAQEWHAAELCSDFAPAFGATTTRALLQGLPNLNPGPPPDAPATIVPAIPTIAALNAAMILSEDRLFFISISIGTSDIREWRLVRLDYESSVRLSPSCIETGKFLCDFYINHPADFRFNAINQRYWLQYVKVTDLQHPDQANDTHLVRPSASSTAFAARNNLVVSRKYVHVLHEDTFIHGPFDFATVHSRKTRDRISQDDWQVLANHSHMFRNTIPSFDVPTYSIHVDNGVHLSFLDKSQEIYSHDSDENSLFGSDTD